MTEANRLQLVGQEIQPDEILPVEQPKINKIAGDAIVLALTALSQRFVTALASLFTLLTVASAFALWYVTPDPNVFQLVKLAMYGIFVLGANWIVRSRR
jgi:hypothetical protein